MSNVIKFNSMREAMQADLGKILKESGLEALNEGADFMVTMAKLLVLRDTGTLENSIRKEQSGDVIRVLAGGYQFLNPKTHRPCTYALHVEHKKPYMKPAHNMVVSLIKTKIKEKVIARVEQS